LKRFLFLSFVTFSLSLSQLHTHTHTHTHICADTNTNRYNGTSNLISACASEDADLDVVRFMLESKGGNNTINQQIRPQTTKWRVIYMLARLSVGAKLNQSVLMTSLAERQGRTALHYAAKRGDFELVELLLNMGADPLIKDSIGKSVRDMCMSFPELRGMLEKRERKMKLRGTAKKTRAIEVLGKRISTATPIQYEMWLISMETLLMLYVYSCRFLSYTYISYISHPPRYGEGSKGRVMEVHQELKTRGFLTRWQDVPSDSEIIFVSHEWLSWAHPDPKGEQLRVLCRVLERLKNGKLNT